MLSPVSVRQYAIHTRQNSQLSSQINRGRCIDGIALVLREFEYVSEWFV